MDSSTVKNDDDDSIGQASPQKFRRPLAHLHEFYLSGYIDSPDNYVEWFDTIRNAGPDDEIRIYINSLGGQLNTAIQFMRVLGETNATVTCSIEGDCASAATMIFLCADRFEVTPYSIFMIHNYSGGSFGKGGEKYSQAIFERKWSGEFLSHIYKDFLTIEEIGYVLDDKDFWLDHEEVVARCKKLVKAREAEARRSQKDDEIE